MGPMPSIVGLDDMIVLDCNQYVPLGPSYSVLPSCCIVYDLERLL